MKVSHSRHTFAGQTCYLHEERFCGQNNRAFFMVTRRLFAATETGFLALACAATAPLAAGGVEFVANGDFELA